MVSPSEIKELPLEPGCYLFKSKEGEVIYVGKAKQLRKRVASYFQNKELDNKTKTLVAHINKIDFIVTRTEVEALILESSLIKKHYPRYNIDLKDARRYAYIHLVDDELPWIEIERVRGVKGEYYGPFVSGAMRRLITDVLSRYFKILLRKPSPRLRKSIDKEIYAKRVQQARQILKGNVDEIITNLKKEMESASGKTYYEYAMSLRNQIQALETLKDKQRIELTRSVDAHVINFVVSGDQVYLIIFSVRKGVLEGKEEYNFAYYEGFFDQFLIQYYDNAPIPQELILPQTADPALADYLSNRRRSKVEVIVPERGEKKDLLDLVLKNVQATFFTGRDRLLALQEALSLPKVPETLECFDISHLGGTGTVASMVSFRSGLPDKSNYRKFKIREASGGDDYWAMREVIKRRYGGTLKSKMKNPDLIIIDGGPGQLSAAMHSLKALDLKIPVVSIAKQFEEIYVPGKEAPIRLPHSHRGLQLVQAIRDEAHRFAVSYQRLLRSKNLLG